MCRHNKGFGRVSYTLLRHGHGYCRTDTLCQLIGNMSLRIITYNSGTNWLEELSTLTGGVNPSGLVRNVPARTTPAPSQTDTRVIPWGTSTGPRWGLRRMHLIRLRLSFYHRNFQSTPILNPSLGYRAHAAMLAVQMALPF